MKRKARESGPALHVIAARLATVLPEPNALIGGLAVAAHGYVRATEDIDFVSPARPEEIRARLAKAGIEATKRRGDVLEGDIPSVVHGKVEGVRFDVIFPPVPIDWNGTITLSLTKELRLRVVDLDTLVRLKLRAAGPQDLIDVVHLLRLHPEVEERALALSESYGVRERLVEWLSDARIRSPKPTRKRSTSRGPGSAPRGGRSRR